MHRRDQPSCEKLMELRKIRIKLEKYKCKKVVVMIEGVGIVMVVIGGASLGFILPVILGFFIICAEGTPFDNPIQPNNNSQFDDTFSKFIEPLDSHSLSSCETLIKHQSPQLEIVGCCDVTSIRPIDPRCLANIEEELRKQANLSASFEQLLVEKWPVLSRRDRINSTTSLEDLLRRQAILLESFQAHLKEIWCLLDPSQKQKFILSYEDLLKRQSNLLLRFEGFLHLQQTLDQTITIKYLASFEDLIRREAILLDSLEDLLKVKCNKLHIDKSANKSCLRPGGAADYTYVITNTDNSSIKDVTIIDDQLGLIANGIELGPKETKSFTKSVYLNGSCGYNICNRAEVFGIDSKGFLVYGLSQEVCIKIVCGRTNIDSITLGSQRAIAMATDPAMADNSIEIVKNQKSGCHDDCNSFNEDKIGIGNQIAAAYNNGGSAANHIRIESNAA
jgi:hypothetical protein